MRKITLLCVFFGLFGNLAQAQRSFSLEQIANKFCTCVEDIFLSSITDETLDNILLFDELEKVGKGQQYLDTLANEKREKLKIAKTRIKENFEQVISTEMICMNSSDTKTIEILLEKGYTRADIMEEFTRKLEKNKNKGCAKLMLILDNMLLQRSPK